MEFKPKLSWFHASVGAGVICHGAPTFFNWPVWARGRGGLHKDMYHMSVWLTEL